MEWKASKQRQATYCEGRNIKGWEFKLGIRAASDAGLTQFMIDNKHEDIGMIRKGNEVHINPFLKSTPNPDQPA